MKTLKTLLAITFSTVGLGSAVGLGVASGNNVKFLSANATAPTNTRRIWILNNDNWWTDNNFFVHAWNDNGNVDTAKVTNVLSDYYHGLGYVDVTLAGATTSLKIQVVNSWGDYGQTVTLELPAFGGADVVWMNNGGTWDSAHNRNDRNAELKATTGFSGAQLGVIMSKYDSCSDANTNGYNAYPQVNTNFVIPTDDDQLDSLVYNSTYTIRQHLAGMNERYSA